MRKLILALFVGACSFSAYSQSQIPLPTFKYTPLDSQGNVIRSSVIDDGRYKATVKYYNNNTGTQSNYTLQVDVVDDRVIRIHFGNGGYIQVGSNNYTGGQLEFYSNSSGNLDSADTVVKVYRSGYYEYYKVEL